MGFESFFLFNKKIIVKVFKDKLQKHIKNNMVLILEKSGLTKSLIHYIIWKLIQFILFIYISKRSITI